MSSTLKRALFHIFVGLSIALPALFLTKAALLIFLGLITFTALFFEVLRFRNKRVNAWFLSLLKPLLREYETSRLTGASYMLAASLISFLVFERDIAVLAICFLAVGDALAAIASKYLSRKSPPGKTWGRNLACFISCAVIGLVFYYAGFGIHWVTALVGAIVATIVEAVPIPINDNLTMPLLAGLAMTLMPL